VPGWAGLGSGGAGLRAGPRVGWPYVVPEWVSRHPRRAGVGPAGGGLASLALKCCRAASGARACGPALRVGLPPEITPGSAVTGRGGRLRTAPNSRAFRASLHHCA
jgi:hypothetical protein